MAYQHDLDSPFIAKLEHGARLTFADRAKLRELGSGARRVDARTTLIREGERPRDAYLMIDGIACRCKILPDGSRQILAYLLPGDICLLDMDGLVKMDHSIATLSPCNIVDVSRDVVDDLTRHHPHITLALRWAALVEESTLREWLVSMGRRTGSNQMAHLFCELLIRFRAIGRTLQDSYHLPLTQEEIGDALGLSVVHVNRILQALREDQLVTFKRKRLTILDFKRLKERAEFNPNYLHLRPFMAPLPGRQTDQFAATW